MLEPIEFNIDTFKDEVRYAHLEGHFDKVGMLAEGAVNEVKQLKDKITFLESTISLLDRQQLLLSQQLDSKRIAYEKLERDSLNKSRLLSQHKINIKL